MKKIQRNRKILWVLIGLKVSTINIVQKFTLPKAMYSQCDRSAPPRPSTTTWSNSRTSRSVDSTAVLAATSLHPRRLTLEEPLIHPLGPPRRGNRPPRPPATTSKPQQHGARQPESRHFGLAPPPAGWSPGGGSTSRVRSAPMRKLRPVGAERWSRYRLSGLEGCRKRQLRAPVEDAPEEAGAWGLPGVLARR